MVQILESNDAVAQLGKGLTSLPDAVAQFMQRKRAESERKRQEGDILSENRALNELGYQIPEGIKNPKIRESLLEAGNKKKQIAQEHHFDEKDYETIKDAFGEKFANVWKASPVGGRTALLQAGIQSGLRKEDIEDLFHLRKEREESPELRGERSEIPKLQNGKIPSDLNLPDFTKRPPGYSPKEWSDERSTWRKENSLLFDENKKRVKANERDLLGVNSLENLNETRRIGEGFERLLINPNTGDFYGVAQLSGAIPPEAQQWVKEIARFGNRAKDAYGSRVTNFDLQQYMRQFPGLLNTYEGRQRILRMMKINLELDNLYDSTSRQLYQKKGLSNIPPEEMDRIVQEMIQNDAERLRQEYVNLDEENQNQGQNVPQGMVLLLDPNGKPLHVPEEEVQRLISLGATLPK